MSPQVVSYTMSQPSNYDLKALKNLFLLHRERSVTKAAKVAGITQPSMSRILNKLRQQYNDRLFVRQKVVTTPDLVAAFSLLMKADYLMIVPAGLANYLCPSCIHYTLPIISHFDNAHAVAYCLYWGAIKDQDPLHQYIREIIKTSFLSQWPSIAAI